MDREDHALLQKVKSSWTGYKSKTNTSQAKAAKALDMNQSAFSQYLRGHIPINTDFLQKFGKLTGDDLTGLSVDIQNLKSRTLSIKYALSNAEPLVKNIIVSSAVAVDDCYGVVVDVEHFYDRDSIILIDPQSDIRDLDKAVLVDNDTVKLGTVHKVEDRWIIRVQSWGTCLDIEINGQSVVHKATSIYFPDRTGTVIPR
jgi:transcriptional regulator with XRE-family HTH domain